MPKLDKNRIKKSFGTKVQTLVNLENNTLEQYEMLLSNFKEWKHYKREIKLNSLLDNKKIEFRVNVSSHTTGALYVNVLVDGDNDFDLLKKASCSIESLKFILKDSNVLELEISLITLKTEWGKIVKELIESDVNLELKQFMVDRQVKSFYFEYPKMSA